MIPLLSEFIGRCETRIHTSDLKNHELFSLKKMGGGGGGQKFWGGFSPQSPPQCLQARTVTCSGVETYSG